jgi:hypothetical protein
LFGVFCLTALASTLLNPGSATPKELALLCISLSAYPACRLISIDDIGGLQRAFVIVIGIIVCVGTVATLCALLQQWDSPHGKPLVFSFNAAPTYFLTSLGFLMLLLMTMTLTPRSTAVISVLSFLPTAIFAASMVRFVFIALAASMLIALMTAERRKRKFIGVIIGVFLTAIMTGLAARSAQTRSLAELSLEESVVVGDDEDRSPSCNMRIDARNSIAIRRALAEDALFLIPKSGPIGTGLDSFMRKSCINAEVHDSVLQAMVEFGWIGGTTLVLLIASSAGPLLRYASLDRRAQFLFCGIAYVFLLALVYGRLSQDVMFFAFLGMANGAVASVRACPPQSL